MEEKKKTQEVFLDLGTTPSLYANHVNVSVSPWDMRLTFNQIVNVEDGKITYKTVGVVHLSPGQAKALRRLLLTKAGKHDLIWSKAEGIIETIGEERDPEESKDERPSNQS